MPSHIRTVAVLPVLLFCSVAAFSATYIDLRNAKPDGRVIAVSGMTFQRDVYQFTLSGQLHLLTRVDGRTFGAVFTGQGSYELKPASVVEQRQLAINTGDDKLTSLSDTFESAIFFASDLLASAEKQGGAPKEGPPNPSAQNTFDEYLKRQRKDFTTNIHIRILQDVLNAPMAEPFFFAWLDGKKYPPALLIIDPLGADAVRLTPGLLGGEETMMLVYDQTKGSAWYLSHPKKEIDTGRAVVELPLIDAEHYLVDTTIAPNTEISGSTEMTYKVNAADLRVLPINIMSRLRLQDGTYKSAGAAEWKSVEIIQENEKEDADAAVVFPSPLTSGERYTLKLTYRGKEVLLDAGDGNFSVGARQSWYANVGTFDDLATFELKFRNPQKLQIIAVGDEIENRVEGNQRLSTWKSARPLRVAGFNYGNFRKLSQDDKDSGMVVDVYTNPGTPDVIREINMYLEAMSQDPSADYVGPGFVKADTARLAQSAMADGINTARVGNVYFGRLPQKRVAITQQSQWSFGQSWPSLIYMPFLAFLDGTTRMTLGLTSAKDFVDSVGAHEFGHQWWGHHVGWRSYHDQWLSEGFAEFTASLVVQTTGGWDKFNRFWEKKRRYILERPRGANIGNDEAGPITQGWRLSTWRNQTAYDALVYAKGAYVLHMLRMTMQGRGEEQDKAFIDMMTDFATTFAGRNPSTNDFQLMVEKHATPTLKLTKDGKVDWFFNQWVYGTAIPRYASKLDFKDVGNGKYKVTGSITQSEVPDDFAVVMPIYVNFDKNSYGRLGVVAIIGNTTKNIDVEVPLQKRPRGFSINNNHDILAR